MRREDRRRQPLAAQRRLLRVPLRQQVLARACARGLLRSLRVSGPVEPRRIDRVRVERIDGVRRALAARRAPRNRPSGSCRGRGQVQRRRGSCRGPASSRTRGTACPCRTTMLKNWQSRQREARILPRLAAVVGDGEALVEYVDQVVRVVGIDPEAVVVAARRLEALERLAAVVGHVQPEAHRVDRVRIVRIDADLAEHPAVGVRVRSMNVFCSAREAAHLRPRLALVVGAVDRGALDESGRRQAVRVVLLLLGGLARDLVVVHERVDDVRLRPADIEADAAAELRLGQALVDRLPRLAGVDRSCRRRCPSSRGSCAGRSTSAECAATWPRTARSDRPGP